MDFISESKSTKTNYFNNQIGQWTKEWINKNARITIFCTNRKAVSVKNF